MDLVEDVVVIVPGIQGSQLWKGDRQIWGLSASAMWRALSTLGGTIKALELPPTIGDDDAPDGIEARGIMPDLLHGLPGFGPLIRGYSGLTDWLKSTFGLREPTPTNPGNLLEFGYDWRLSNRASARRLKMHAEHEWKRWRDDGHPGARLVLLCHSMGGLVARYYLDVLGGAEITRSLVTFGSPHRGAADAVLRLVNGVKVGKGPLKIDVSALGRSLPSTYQLLPTYRCVNTTKGRQTLGDARLPWLDPDRVADAARFHEEIGDVTDATPYLFRMVVGTRQPTWTTVDRVGDRVVGRRTIDGNDERGDGTVPRFASIPLGVAPTDLRQLSSAQTHGWVHLHRSALDDLHGILTARELVYMEGPDARRALEVQPAVAAPEFVSLGAPIPVEVTSASDELLLWAAIFDADGHEVQRVIMHNLGDGCYSATVSAPNDGIHVITIAGRPGSGIDPVSTPITIADVEEV